MVISATAAGRSSTCPSSGTAVNGRPMPSTPFTVPVATRMAATSARSSGVRGTGERTARSVSFMSSGWGPRTGAAGNRGTRFDQGEGVIRGAKAVRVRPVRDGRSGQLHFLDIAVTRGTRADDVRPHATGRLVAVAPRHGLQDLAVLVMRLDEAIALA